MTTREQFEAWFRSYFDHGGHPGEDHLWNCWQAASPPPGWVLVPEEPTRPDASGAQKMIAAWVRESMTPGSTEYSCYRALIAARPPIEQGGKQEIQTPKGTNP